MGAANDDFTTHVVKGGACLVFNLRPSPIELLTAAARAVAEWNPHDTSGPARAEVMLAGRAAALALRELCSEHEVKQTTARDIVSFYGEAADDSGQQEIAPLPLWARLAKDIRAGQFDDGPDALTVHALLTAAAGRSTRFSLRRQAAGQSKERVWVAPISQSKVCRAADRSVTLNPRYRPLRHHPMIQER